MSALAAPRSASPVAVIDEAFAGLSSSDVMGEGSQDRQPLNQTLVAEIATQLAALDRQREQLAHLLESVNLTTLAR
jgi:hypothetical protein